MKELTQQELSNNIKKYEAQIACYEFELRLIYKQLEISRKIYEKQQILLDNNIKLV